MVVINWQNDPLLFDTEPTPMNEWETANSILSMEYQTVSSFLDVTTLTFNLYPILVRKIDFVSKTNNDRIISRFPFIVLLDEEKSLIKDKILLIAEFARDYFYKSINSGILDWRKRIQKYLKRGAMPYPLFRCACAILNLPLTNPKVEELHFESARGKRYAIPAKLTNALTYLCGVANGDGHLHRHWFRITDETKEYMLLLSKLFEQMFHDPGDVFLTGNAWNVELRSASVSRIINFLTDQTIEGAKYDSLQEPLLFKHLGSPFRNYYWRGAMDADGSFKNQLTFTSASEKFTFDFQLFLESINISSTIKQKPSGPYRLYIPAKNKLKYVQLVGALNPKKSEDLLDFLQRKRNYSVFNGIKKTSLTKDGYFNFDLLDSLFVLGLGDLLKVYRSEKSYTTMDEQFELSHGSYTKMEKNQRSLPYSMLKEVISNYPNAINTIYDVLEQYSGSIRFQVSNSNSIKLPLKPSEKLVNILPSFDPKINYVLVTMLDNQLESAIKEIFDITITDARINCRMLLHFLVTFYNYIDDCPILTVREFYVYKKKWREEIFS
ncbi:MAG: LAGLIDADG family homing endonuclease [Candidatus Heimdallarchaeota archaeon]